MVGGRSSGFLQVRLVLTMSCAVTSMFSTIMRSTYSSEKSTETRLLCRLPRVAPKTKRTSTSTSGSPCSASMMKSAAA